jgi:hypothetical protein
MNVHDTARVEVLETSFASDLMLAAVQLITGDVREGMFIETEDKHERWEIKGLAFVPADAWQTGRRGLSLRPAKEGAVLRPGQILKTA